MSHYKSFGSMQDIAFNGHMEDIVINELIDQWRVSQFWGHHDQWIDLIYISWRTWRSSCFFNLIDELMHRLMA